MLTKIPRVFQFHIGENDTWLQVHLQLFTSTALAIAVTVKYPYTVSHHRTHWHPKVSCALS